MMDNKIPFFAKNAIGEIPEDWNIELLSKLTYFQEGPGIRKWQFAKEGIPFLNIRCITESGDIDFDNIQYIDPEEVEDRYEHFLLESGDTIVSSSGTLGKMAVIKEKHLPLMLNTSIIRFRSDDDNLSDEYMRYYLNSKAFMLQFEFMSQGSAQVNVGPTHLKQMYMINPPLKEQKKIADILSSVDKTIEKTDQVIEKTKELKKGLMQELLTKGIGHDEFKEVRIGTKKSEIPKDWNLVNLDELVDLKNGKFNPTKNLSNDYEIPVYGGNGITGYYNEPLVDKSTIVIGRVGEYCGSIHLVKEKSWVTDNAIYINKVYSNKFTNLNFLALYLKFANLNNLSNRTGQPKLTQSRILSVRIPLPPLEEQKKIANILSTVDGKIQKEEEYKSKLEELKKGLMQKLLTGEVRVKVAN